MSVANLPMLLGALFVILPPFLTELLTRANASQAVKSVVNVVLVAGAATATQFVVESSWDWKEAGLKFVVAWGLSLAVHYSGATRKLQDATAGVGVGGNRAEDAYIDEPEDDDLPEAA